MEPTIKENIPNKVTKPKNHIPWISQEIAKNNDDNNNEQERIHRLKNQTTVILKSNIKI